MKGKSFEVSTVMTNKNGRYQINCRKGLWGVDAPSLEEAAREAVHYFTQYLSDGEYDECNTRLVNKLTNKR